MAAALIDTLQAETHEILQRAIDGSLAIIPLLEEPSTFISVLWGQPLQVLRILST